MLLVTGAVALSRKLVDEKAKRDEAKQGRLKVGDSEIAKRAFVSQSSIARNPPTITTRPPTEIKFEDPNDVAATTPAISSPSIVYGDVRHSSRLDVSSPVKSGHGVQEPYSPYSDSVYTSSHQQSLQLPPHTSRAVTTSNAMLNTTAESNMLRPSLTSADTDTASMVSFDTNSGCMIRSTNSNGTHALRIKTVGSDLKSGFPYHEALFEMNVHPQKWTAFTNHVTDSSKLNSRDLAATWASATAVALTGAIGTSVMLGRSMTRAAQEKKIKAGLASVDSALGETLKIWNEEYFGPRGLFVHLELSESAMNNPRQQSKALRKGVLLYSKQEDRIRKREERKFVIVVTRLDDDGAPAEALRELEIEEKRAEEEEQSPIEEDLLDVPEIGSSDILIDIQELPYDHVKLPAELPGDEQTSSKSLDAPAGHVEVSGDNTLLLEKMHMYEYAHAGNTVYHGAGSLQEKMTILRVEEQYDARPSPTYRDDSFRIDYIDSPLEDRTYPPAERSEKTTTGSRATFREVPRLLVDLEGQDTGYHSQSHGEVEEALESKESIPRSETAARECPASQGSNTSEPDDQRDEPDVSRHKMLTSHPSGAKPEPAGASLYDGAGWGDDYCYGGVKTYVIEAFLRMMYEVSALVFGCSPRECTA